MSWMASISRLGRLVTSSVSPWRASSTPPLSAKGHAQLRSAFSTSVASRGIMDWFKPPPTANTSVPAPQKSIRNFSGMLRGGNFRQFLRVENKESMKAILSGRMNASPIGRHKHGPKVSSGPENIDKLDDEAQKALESIKNMPIDKSHAIYLIDELQAMWNNMHFDLLQGADASMRLVKLKEIISGLAATAGIVAQCRQAIVISLKISESATPIFAESSSHLTRVAITGEASSFDAREEMKNWRFWLLHTGEELTLEQVMEMYGVQHS